VSKTNNDHNGAFDFFFIVRLLIYLYIYSSFANIFFSIDKMTNSLNIYSYIIDFRHDF